MIRPAPGTTREEFELGADMGWGMVILKPVYMGIKATEFNEIPDAPRWWYDSESCREIALRLKVVRR